MKPVVIRIAENLGLTTCPPTKNIKRMFTVELSARLPFQGLLFHRIFIIISLAGFRFKEEEI